MVAPLRIATRTSALAQAQTAEVAAVLRAQYPGLLIETLLLRTEGDLRLEEPLHAIGGKGLFTREIDDALLDGRADLAVHSLKDLPTSLHPNLCIGAIPPRESDADVLVLPSLDAEGGGGVVPLSIWDLAEGAEVATGSLRRGAQLLRMRPDLRLAPVRGNIDTRLRKLREKGWGGLVLAEAGLHRLGREGVPRVVLPAMLPAAGQGALACMIRVDDTRLRAMVASLHDEVSALRVWAERSFLATLEAGCHAPVGVRTRFLAEGRLHLRGGIFSQDGSDALLAEGVAEANGHIDIDAIGNLIDDADAHPAVDPEADAARTAWHRPGGGGGRMAEEFGAAVARELLERGAGRLLAGGASDA